MAPKINEDKMMKPNQKAALWRKIEDYAAAMVADSWKGAGDPEDYESLIRGLEEAKNELRSYIDTLSS